jgi:hypothetical protein
VSNICSSIVPKKIDSTWSFKNFYVSSCQPQLQISLAYYTMGLQDFESEQKWQRRYEWSPPRCLAWKATENITNIIWLWLNIYLNEYSWLTTTLSIVTFIIAAFSITALTIVKCQHDSKKTTLSIMVVLLCRVSFMPSFVYAEYHKLTLYSNCR